MAGGFSELVNPGQDNMFSFVLAWTLFFGMSAVANVTSLLDVIFVSMFQVSSTVTMPRMNFVALTILTNCHVFLTQYMTKKYRDDSRVALVTLRSTFS